MTQCAGGFTVALLAVYFALGVVAAAGKEKNMVPETPSTASPPANVVIERFRGSSDFEASIAVVDQAKLKALLPESVGALNRKRIESEKTAAGTFKISKAEAEYSDPADNSHHVKISITDIGSNKMLAAMFGMGFMEMEKETETGYEKMGKVDGRPTHETFHKDGPSGEYSLLVGGRFLVEARGQKVDMDTMRQVASAVGFDKLEAMKNDGVKQ